MARLRKYIELYRYNIPIEFGEMVSAENEDGVSRPDFKTSFSLRAAAYTVAHSEELLNSGPNQQEQLYFAVQEIGMVRLNMLARLDDKIYTVDQVQPGDAYDPRSWDILRLTWGNGVERGYRK